MTAPSGRVVRNTHHGSLLVSREVGADAALRVQAAIRGEGEAAEALGLSRGALYRRMEKYGL